MLRRGIFSQGTCTSPGISKHSSYKYPSGGPKMVQIHQLDVMDHWWTYVNLMGPSSPCHGAHLATARPGQPVM